MFDAVIISNQNTDSECGEKITGTDERILIVDDTPDNLVILAGMFKKRGYLIQTARDGYAALASVKSHPPDLILLDIMMPSPDGFEVCEALKKNETTRNIPVIFISALGDVFDKVKAFSVGGIDYIPKPFHEKEVLARVRTHLTFRKLQQALEEERDRFRTLAEATFEGILIHDSGVIIEANQAMQKLTGYEREELVGKRASELLSSEFRKFTRKALKPGEIFPYEICGVTKEGRHVLFEIREKNIRYQGRDLGILAIRDITKPRRLERENISLKASLSQAESFGDMIGKSPEMRRAYEQIANAAASEETVAIYGETGTGKELAARMIFRLSQSYQASFVAVNCSAIQETLFESQFFGYRKGAFTNAMKDTPGFFEQAKGGTLFLDEIGELTLGMQAKLLRVLQDNEYTPLGASTANIADVRIIAATNRELRELMNEGKIRTDFFHRIHVITLHMPPLRKRKEDIPLLIEGIIRKKTPEDQTLPMIPKEVVDQFMDYDWPGNVRELSNEVRRYIVTGETELGGPPMLETLQSGDLPFLAEGMPLLQAVKSFEQYYITRAVERHGGNKKQAAKALNVDRKTLYNKMNKSP